MIKVVSLDRLLEYSENRSSGMIVKEQILFICQRTIDSLQSTLDENWLADEEIKCIWKRISSSRYFSLSAFALTKRQCKLKPPNLCLLIRAWSRRIQSRILFRNVDASSLAKWFPIRRRTITWERLAPQIYLVKWWFGTWMKGNLIINDFGLCISLSLSVLENERLSKLWLNQLFLSFPLRLIIFGEFRRRVQSS